MVGQLPPASTGATGQEQFIGYLNGIPQTLTAEQIGDFSGASIKYGLQWAVWFNQTPNDGELLALYTAPVEYAYPANFAGSAAAAPLTPPAHSVTLTIGKQTAGVGAFVTVGTVVISTAGVVTFATTNGDPIEVLIGDRLQVTGPSPADGTIAGFAMTLKGVAPITSGTVN